MKKQVVTLVLSVFVLALVQAQDYYWVFFKNRAGSTFNPYEYFDAKAIERYRMNGVSLMDSTNFPLNGGYVSQVEGVCEDFVGESRWLNAVGVGATPEQISAIAEMSFVSRIVPLAGDLELASSKIAPAAKSRDTNLWSLGVLPQLRRMKGERFVAKGIDGKGIRIAVIDGGFPKVDVDPVFKHLRDNKRIAATWNFVKKKADVYGWNKHGTNVLSCIAGKNDTMQMGLATGAEFLLAIVESDRYNDKLEEIWWIRAAEWADKNGADIINSSINYGEDLHFAKDMDGTSIVSKAANIAAGKGILVCNSAGNGYKSYYRIAPPADADSVLTVSSVCSYLDENKYYVNHSNSGGGPTVDGRLKPNVCSYKDAVFASGTDAISTLSTLSWHEGTSFSCALVSGFAACAWQCRKGYTAMQIKAEIERSADLYPYYDYYFGYGVPQATYFIGEKKQPQPTFHFEEDSAKLYVIVPVKDSLKRLLFSNLALPDGRLVLYRQDEFRGDTVGVVAIDKKRCSGYKANFSLGGYTASYLFEGAMQDTIPTGVVFKVYGEPRSAHGYSRDICDILLRKEDRTEFEPLFFQMGAVINDGNSDLRNWMPTFTVGFSVLYQVTKVYKLGVGFDYHRRNYKAVKDIRTGFDEALGLPEDMMSDVKSKRLIQRGFTFELFQRIRFANLGGYVGNHLSHHSYLDMSNDIHWDLGVYGSLNFQSYSLKLDGTGDYCTQRLRYNGLRFASPWDWGVVTRFNVLCFGIYGRCSLKGIGKSYNGPEKYFEQLPRFEVGVEMRFSE